MSALLCLLWPSLAGYEPLATDAGDDTARGQARTCAVGSDADNKLHPKAQPPKSGEFLVSLRGGACAEPLGIHVQEAPASLEVLQVGGETRAGSVERWNLQHPGRQLQCGDHIVAVNGVKGTGAHLKAAVDRRGSKELALSVRRPRSVVDECSRWVKRFSSLVLVLLVAGGASWLMLGEAPAQALSPDVHLPARPPAGLLGSAPVPMLGGGAPPLLGAAGPPQPSFRSAVAVADTSTSTSTTATTASAAPPSAAATTAAPSRPPATAAAEPTSSPRSSTTAANASLWSMLPRGFGTLVTDGNLDEVKFRCVELGREYLPTMGLPRYLSKASSTREHGKRVIRCQKICAGTEGCEHFTYEIRSRTCWLSGDNAVARRSESLSVSGPPRCPPEDGAANSTRGPLTA